MTDGTDAPGTTDEDTARKLRPGRAVAEVTLVARVQDDGERPDTCTIHPLDVDDWAALTTWISADGGSFVSLDERR